MSDATTDTVFDHVILTRFSVRFGDAPPPADDWLLYRWAFFRDALAASVSRQTSRAFQWLVFFDAETPDWLREEIELLCPGLFTPVFVASWSSRVAQEETARVTSAPYLITTRVDSDDALARQFVADIHSTFDRQESLYVNLLCGVQVERTGELYRYDEPSGAFISYIEKREDASPPRTVFFSLSHASSRDFAGILNVVGPPRWMQVIHGSNIANCVRGLRVRPEPIQADFDMDLPFDRAIGTADYLRQRSRSVLDLLRLWAVHPHFAKEFLRARRLRRAGTQLLPQRTAVASGAPVRQAPRIVRPLLAVLRRREFSRRLARNSHGPVED